MKFVTIAVVLTLAITSTQCLRLLRCGNENSSSPSSPFDGVKEYKFEEFKQNNAALKVLTVENDTLTFSGLGTPLKYEIKNLNTQNGTFDLNRLSLPPMKALGMTPLTI